MYIRAAMLAIGLLLSTRAHTEELYIVQGFASGTPLGPGATVLWSTDAFFVNTGTTPATVNLLGVSNGGWNRATPLLSIPAERSASLTRTLGGNLNPVAPATLWVLRADVPAGVQVESLLFIGSYTDSGGPAPPVQAPYRFGKARLPVFTTLVPPNERQYHLGTYLGDPAEIPSRLNTAIYNAGATAATARVEIRQHCDDVIVEAHTITVPPDTLVQVGGFRTTETACPSYMTGTLGGPPGAMYTVVSVDQPSISFVTNLANREIPTTSITVTTSAR